MRLGDSKHFVALMAPQPFNEDELKRLQPQLRRAIVPLNMHVRRLEPVSHVEVAAFPK